VRLLDAIEQYGYGNWEDISRHIETKTADGKPLNMSPRQLFQTRNLEWKISKRSEIVFFK